MDEDRVDSNIHASRDVRALVGGWANCNQEVTHAW
jgi:hypothetical protein